MVDALTKPPEFKISSTAIDVWHCPLNPDTEPAGELQELLSPEEQQRAQQLRFPDKRHQFISSRACLRQCLAWATGSQPDAIEIETARGGKPYLGGAERDSGIQFNVTHTDGLALIALTLGQPIGIDVELLRDTVDHRRLAKQYFSPAEQEALGARSEEQLSASFFACWTRKEALLKAVGTGIAAGLDGFDVSIDPARRRQGIQLSTADGSNEHWWIESLPCGESFVGALACQQESVEVRRWSI